MGRRRPFLIVAGILSIVCWIAMGYTREMGEALGDHGDGTDREETDRSGPRSLRCSFTSGWTSRQHCANPRYASVADFAGDRQTTGAALAWLLRSRLQDVALVHGHVIRDHVHLRWCRCDLAKETPLSHPQWMPCLRVLESSTRLLPYTTESAHSPSARDLLVAFFFVQYGYTAYNGNKGQFFGLEVYGGVSENADSCDPCSAEQDAYNHGVSVAGGRADLLYNVVGYVWAWALPFMVHKIGVKWVLTISTVPQVLYTAMAWTSSPGFNVFVVAVTGITHAVWFTLVVPVIIHVFGEEEDIGVYVGALNSANCFGQLLNFAIGTGLVQTSLGYKLPVFVGGISSFLGFLTILVFFKMKMNSIKATTSKTHPSPESRKAAMSRVHCLTRRSGCCSRSQCRGWLSTWPGRLSGQLSVPTCRRCCPTSLFKSLSSSVPLSVCWSAPVSVFSVTAAPPSWSTPSVPHRRWHLSIICWIAMSYTRAMGEALGDHGDGTDGQPTDRTWTSILTVFFYLWMDITVNVVQTPAMLLVADFAGDRQTTGAALGQAWSTLGSILVAGYIELFGAAHKTLHEFMWMLSATMFICISVAVVFVSTWKRIGHAFASVYHGIRTLPGVLAIYGVCFFFVQYGYTAYNGNKGQFFGLEVYDGSAENADSCDPCTPEQDAYNHGVSIAGGRADLLFNIVGYVYSWTLPFLVHKFGVKVGSDALDHPADVLMIMAWTSSVTLNVFIVAITSITQAVWFALIVPVIIHVFGEDEEIGIYVGALNSANCFGQLLNFAIGSGLVETSLGYKLPVFLGGIMSALGFITALLFFKMKMYSM
ncbi:Major facilitator superfamily domain [Phytophthora cactorum]|nr:Major facilitator superfamily domain [Phytophthora cactorum]